VLAVCWVFHLLFEAPFLRYRDMRSLRALPLLRVRLPRRPRTALPAADVGPVANDA
jgi:hypothetical protein